jgi:hypothetical protein
MGARQKNFLEKIGRLIPGYVGYALRLDQRISDKHLRCASAIKLQKLEEFIVARQKKLVLDHAINEFKNLESLRRILNILIHQLKNASYGGSSLFSRNEIGKVELDVIFQMDKMIDQKIIALLKLHENLTIDSPIFLKLKFGLTEIQELLNKRTEYIQSNK